MRSRLDRSRQRRVRETLAAPRDCPPERMPMASKWSIAAGFSACFSASTDPITETCADRQGRRKNGMEWSGGNKMAWRNETKKKKGKKTSQTKKKTSMTKRFEILTKKYRNPSLPNLKMYGFV